MKYPEFLTFTGADDKTSIGEMINLSNRFPIEWAILISKDRAGTSSYPSIPFIDTIRQFGPTLRLSLHVCGSYSKEIIETRRCKDIAKLIDGFQRIQINHKPFTEISHVMDFARKNGVAPIVQCRGDDFPDDPRVTWLYDKSGGNGIIPDNFPSHTDTRLVGYAGGLGIDNIKTVCDNLNASGPFWLDMQSKIRNDDDELDLNICEKICTKIYDRE